ncbi:MAG: nucleotide exchange factor GrpE [Candidatus Acidiferrales bacterium]
MSAHKNPNREKPEDGPALVPDSPAVGSDSAPESGAADTFDRLLAEKQDLQNTLVRRQADFDNYRKRVEKERIQDRHRGVESLIEQLLPVLDNFDRALAVVGDAPATAEFRKGFDLIRRQLWDALSKQGLERIESAGQEFNPHLHHAIDSAESADHPDGTVLGELQPGYTFHGRVLRPAMVRVSVAPSSKSASSRDN